MTLARPLWDYVRVQAATRPDALAVYGPGGATSYQALCRDVDALTTALLEHALTPDDMVGLHLGPAYLHVLLILALDRLSIPSMSFAAADPATPPVVPPQRGLTVVISAAAAPDDPPCRWLRMTETDRPQLGGADHDRLATLDGTLDDPVRVCWSSGTTGGAKGALITREVQAHRLMTRRLLRGIGAHTRYLVAMPLAVSSCYATVLSVLAAGGAVILPVPGGDFVAQATALGVTATTVSPALLAGVLGPDGKIQPRLETLEVLEVVGAHLPPPLAESARRELTPHVAITYGSSEAGRIATGDAALVASDPSAIGFVLPEVEVEIVDLEDRPLAPGGEGIVRVRGPQTVVGYFNDDAATERNFRDGWFYPGDLGALTGDRLLRITGRIEEMIPLDDALISPLSLEQAFRGIDGVRDVAVFSLPEASGPAAVCAALVLERATTPATVRADVAARLGSRAPGRLFVVEQLPRSATGKVMRRELADMARREPPS